MLLLGLICFTKINAAAFDKDIEIRLFANQNNIELLIDWLIVEYEFFELVSGGNL